MLLGCRCGPLFLSVCGEGDVHASIMLSCIVRQSPTRSRPGSEVGREENKGLEQHATPCPRALCPPPSRLGENIPLKADCERAALLLASGNVCYTSKHPCCRIPRCCTLPPLSPGPRTTSGTPGRSARDRTGRTLQFFSADQETPPLRPPLGPPPRPAPPPVSLSPPPPTPSWPLGEGQPGVGARSAEELSRRPLRALTPRPRSRTWSGAAWQTGEQSVCVTSGGQHRRRAFGVGDGGDAAAAAATAATAGIFAGKQGGGGRAYT